MIMNLKTVTSIAAIGLIISLTGCATQESHFKSMKQETCFTPDMDGSIGDGMITVTPLKPSSSGKVEKEVYIEPGMTWKVNNNTGVVTIKPFKNRINEICVNSLPK